MAKMLESNLVLKAKDINEISSEFKFENVVYENGGYKVEKKETEGIIYSPEYETKEFEKLVGSWCALCDKETKSSIEVMISVYAKGKYSKYFTYGEWSLGGENLYYDQDDEFVHMSVDEIILKENELGQKFKFKIVLKNEAVFKLICIMIKAKYFEENKPVVELNNMPSTVLYDVPKLNQNMVPVIGHEMCSATTTAMLLKFKGMDFSKEDSEFEHRYVASLVADNGHHAPTYGNWVFNTTVMGAFGYDSYVYRMYSWEELKYHLAKVGPVGASIRGNTGLYKTGGHLLVVTGYKEVDGKTYVVCNDPNINSRFGEGLFVSYDYPLDVFMGFWRGVTYIIE